ARSSPHSPDPGGGDLRDGGTAIARKYPPPLLLSVTLLAGAGPALGAAGRNGAGREGAGRERAGRERPACPEERPVNGPGDAAPVSDAQPPSGGLPDGQAPRSRGDAAAAPDAKPSSEPAPKPSSDAPPPTLPAGENKAPAAPGEPPAGGAPPG